MEDDFPQEEIDGNRVRVLAESDERLKRSIANPIERMAACWYGYGRWDAPYWFIGLEPGKGKREGNNLAERCNGWEQLGEKSVIDCRGHHDKFYTHWHDRKIEMERAADNERFRPPPQSTWRRLIALLLAFKEKRYDIDALCDYQSRLWGTTDADGETCVIEVSSIASNSLGDDRSLKEAFKKYRHRRLQVIRARLLARHPTFVILYGGGKAAYKAWAYLASGKPWDCFAVEKIEGWDAGFYYDGTTVFVRAKHPVNPRVASPPESYWIGIANQIRSIVTSKCYPTS